MLIEGIRFQKSTICTRPRFYSGRGISEQRNAINHRAVTVRWKDKYWMYTKCALLFPSSSGFQKMFILPCPTNTNLRFFFFFLIWLLPDSPFAWWGPDKEAAVFWGGWGSPYGGPRDRMAWSGFPPFPTEKAPPAEVVEGRGIGGGHCNLLALEGRGRIPTGCFSHCNHCTLWIL